MVSSSQEEATEFCRNVLSIYDIKLIDDKEIGSILLLVALLYILTGVVVLLITRVQSYIAKIGDDYISQSMASVMIFPVFTNILFFNAIINLLVGFAYLFFSYAIDDQHSNTSIVIFSFVWGIQHFLLEGVAFLLMGKGLGRNSALVALRFALIWGAITTVIQGLINVNVNTISFALTLLWETILLIFYFLLWVTPQKHLFRRPAAILYARFWTIFRLVSIIARILVFIPVTLPIGNCMYVFASLVVFAGFEPIVLYYTLLQDSRWWQGLAISQGKRTMSAEAIRSPLEGVDLNAKSAQALAYNVDAIGRGRTGRGGMVKLLNFAYITLDKTALLGSGSFSKVYRGSYKQENCAIKLIFTVDLTTDIIRRVCAEAEILSNFKHKNIVHIFGVAVLPPSVCILLELCAFGSLADVVRGLTIDPVRALSKESGTQSPLSASSASIRNRDTSKTNSKFVLSTADRLFLAMGCARGLAALHSHSKDLCHRDIKSFNFLVDHQFNAKLADLELGVTDQVRRGGSREIAIFEKQRKAASGFMFGSRYTKSVFGMSVSNSIESDIDGGQGIVSAGVIAADEFLANWAAPEVIVNGVHTQASDIYSLALVLWELITGLVPFSDIGRQDEIRNRVLAGERPVMPTSCYQPIPGTATEASSPWYHYAAIIERGWQHEALARPSANEILNELECLWRAVGNKVIFDSDVNVDLGSHSVSTAAPSVWPLPRGGSSHAAQLLTKSAPVSRDSVMKTISAVQFDSAFQALDDHPSPWLVISAEPPHIVLKCNASWSSITGYIPDEILGKPFASIMTGDLTENNILNQFFNDIAATMFGNATGDPAAAKSELSWHCNLTLYKSADFDFDADPWDVSSEPGVEDGFGVKPSTNRRRQSFQSDRHSLFSMHGYPIRKRAAPVDPPDDPSNPIDAGQDTNSQPNQTVLVAESEVAGDNVRSDSVIGIAESPINRMARALTLTGGTATTPKSPVPPHSKFLSPQITMIAILFSEIKPQTSANDEAKDNSIRASLQSAFNSVTRNSFTQSTPSTSSKGTNPTIVAQTSDNSMRRSFQLKPRGSFSSFRSVGESPNSTGQTLASIFSDHGGASGSLALGDAASSRSVKTLSVDSRGGPSRTTSGSVRSSGQWSESKSNHSGHPSVDRDSEVGRSTVADNSVNSPFHFESGVALTATVSSISPALPPPLPTLHEEEDCRGSLGSSFADSQTIVRSSGFDSAPNGTSAI